MIDKNDKVSINTGRKEVKYRVISDYQSPYPNPLVFHGGDSVIVGKEFEGDPEWSGWVWCKGLRGVKAWAPKSYLNINGEEGVFIRNYNARELSVKRGEYLVVKEILGGFGMAEKPDGDTGWVPMKVLEKC